MKLHSANKFLLSGALFPLLVHTLDAQTARKKAPTDSEILGQVQKTFHDDHAFIGSSILPSVNHGVVTLSGNVRSEAEKTLASSELASIDGVKTVLNNLNIVDNTFHAPPPPKPVAGPSGPKLITLPAGSAVPVRVTDEIDIGFAISFHGKAIAVAWRGAGRAAHHAGKAGSSHFHSGLCGGAAAVGRAIAMWEERARPYCPG